MSGNELKRAAASMEKRETIQVKVCGLTRVDEAVACVEAGARLVGINNRNLTSFETDLGHTLKFLPLLQPGQVAVAASGIRTREDIRRYQAHGVCNFLIGESLVRSENPAGFLKYLRGETDNVGK